MTTNKNPYTKPEQAFFLTKASLKVKYEKMFEHFKKQLTDHLIDKGEFSFIIFEPNKPIKFGNTENEYRSLFSPAGMIDMSCMYPSGTVFLQVEQGYGFITKHDFNINPANYESDDEVHWRNFESKTDIPSEVLATIHLLGIPDFYANRQ